MKVLVTIIFILLAGVVVYGQHAIPDSNICIFPAASPTYDLPQYIKQNLRYPDSALKYDIEGRVFVQFTINEDGTISNAKVIRGLGYGCNEEALRLIENMPRWKNPGAAGKKPVKEIYTQPILFRQD